MSLSNQLNKQSYEPKIDALEKLIINLLAPLEAIVEAYVMGPKGSSFNNSFKKITSNNLSIYSRLVKIADKNNGYLPEDLVTSSKGFPCGRLRLKALNYRTNIKDIDFEKVPEFSNEALLNYNLSLMYGK